MYIPKIAIVDSNTVASIGLRTLLNNIMPNIEIDSFGSFAELQANHPESYFHYFVTVNIVFSHFAFFRANIKKTIVMTTSNEHEFELSSFHCLCISLPENILIKSLLLLEQSAHHNGNKLPHVPQSLSHIKTLSSREIEVLILVVKGFINKEIAEKLNVSLSTIITHRRNIIDKIGRKSVGALTIYAVMHGYVNINEI